MIREIGIYNIENMTAMELLSVWFPRKVKLLLIARIARRFAYCLRALFLQFVFTQVR
jgi:hypothetical protein